MKDRRDNQDIIEALSGIVTLAVDEAIDRKVPPVIKEVVNGKIDKLHAEVLGIKDNMAILNTKMDELTPVRTGITTFNNIKQGAVYMAGFFTPVAIVLGALWALFKLLVMFVPK